MESQQDGRPEHKYCRDCIEESFGQLRIRGLLECCIESQLPERYRRKIEPACPAGLVFPVDIIMVLSGIVMDSFSRLSDQSAPCTEDDGFSRTLLSAYGHDSLTDPFKAHIALFNLRIGTVIFKLRDIERAGDHAVTAPHAFFSVPGNRAHFILQHRLCKTCGCAGRVIAMHALPFYKDFSFVCLIGIDYGPLSLICLALDTCNGQILETGSRKPMSLCAGKLTTLAAGTTGRII